MCWSSSHSVLTSNRRKRNEFMFSWRRYEQATLLTVKWKSKKKKSERNVKNESRMLNVEHSFGICRDVMNDLQNCFAMLINAVIYYLKRSTNRNGVDNKFSFILPEPFFIFGLLFASIHLNVSEWWFIGWKRSRNDNAPTMNEYRN